MPKRREDGDAPVMNHEGNPLTIQESKFIDEYIQTGNAKQSYLKAYNREDNPPNDAPTRGREILDRPNVKTEIRHRMAMSTCESVASREEILRYWTSVMRGETKDAFNLDAPLAERTKASVELAKRIIDIETKISDDNNVNNEVRIVLDWGQGVTPLPTLSSIESSTTPVVTTDDGK